MSPTPLNCLDAERQFNNANDKFPEFIEEIRKDLYTLETLTGAMKIWPTTDTATIDALRQRIKEGRKICDQFDSDEKTPIDHALEIFHFVSTLRGFPEKMGFRSYAICQISGWETRARRVQKAGRWGFRKWCALHMEG